MANSEEVERFRFLLRKAAAMAESRDWEVEWFEGWEEETKNVDGRRRTTTISITVDFNCKEGEE